MANTFLAARGVDVGKCLCEHDLAGDGRGDPRRAPSGPNCTVHLPYDVVVAKEFARQSAERAHLQRPRGRAPTR